MSIEVAIDYKTIIEVTLQYDISSSRWYARTIYEDKSVRGGIILAKGNGRTTESALNDLNDNFLAEKKRKSL